LGTDRTKGSEGGEKEKDEKDKPAVTVAYHVETDSPFYALPKVVSCELDSSSGGGGKRKPSTISSGGKASLSEVTQDTNLSDPNTLLITFNPRAAGQYPCRLLVSGAGQAAADLRCFTLDATVTKPAVETVLEFKAPARQAIVQQIPLVNRQGGVDWSLSCQLTGSKCFKGPKSFKVGAATAEGPTKVGYPLTFTAPWPKGDDTKETDSPEEGLLVMKNGKTGAEFRYKLLGDSEAPLAQEHVVKRCNARESVEIVLKVPNFVGNAAGSRKGAKDVTKVVEVETDLSMVSGPPTMSLEGESGGDYVLKALPQMGGNYTGSVTFKHPGSGEYLWFTLELQVDSPLHEQAIELTATVRTVVSMAIELVNPLDEAIDFEVAMAGDGLLGDPKFTLAPKASGAYELFYSPLIAKKHTGSLAFLNDRVGEFWYKLELLGEAAPPVRLKPVACAVGTKVSIPVPVENPLGKELLMECIVSNPTNFGLGEVSGSNKEVVLPPYGALVLSLDYAPSSLGQVESTTLSLRHPDLGALEFEASGKGELPGVMPEVTPEAMIAEPTSSMITFRNPFKQPMTVDIKLSSERGQSDRTFTLLMRKCDQLVMGPLSTLQIPVSFNPTSIVEKRATLEVRGASVAAGPKALNWVFPLRGLVNAPPHHKALKIAAKAKTSLRQVLEFPLRDLDGMGGKPETFSIEIDVPQNMRKIVDSSLMINPVQATISEPGEPLKYQFSFEPMRPFSTSLKLYVVRSSGGRWPFEIRLDATEPDCDDAITVEAPLKQTGAVTFKLVNRSESYAPFQAFFSSDSALTLAVTPPSGLLAPASKGGTPLTVSYSPKEYGARARGRLVVLTEETQWSFDVFGTKPRDRVPTGKSTIDTKQSARLSTQKSKGSPSKRGGGGF